MMIMIISMLLLALILGGALRIIGFIFKASWGLAKMLLILFCIICMPTLIGLIALVGLSISFLIPAAIVILLISVAVKPFSN
jgi:hypothetical protein